MSSLKAKAEQLPQIDLDGNNDPQFVINVKFGDILIKQILVQLGELEFKGLDPTNNPKIELILTDVE